MSRKLNMTPINDRWNFFYNTKDDTERVKKVSFATNKSNKIAECGCNNKELLSCDLHDGSDEKKAQYFKLVNNYFANYLSFNEKDVMNNLGQNCEIISFCLQSTKDNIARLNERKKEVLEENLIALEQELMTPRVILFEDYDPEWKRFLAKWDNSMLNMASIKKTQKLIKTSLIKGGARELDGSLQYEHLPLMHKLVGILENAEELVFMDYLMV